VSYIREVWREWIDDRKKCKCISLWWHHRLTNHDAVTAAEQRNYKSNSGFIHWTPGFWSLLALPPRNMFIGLHSMQEASKWNALFYIGVYIRSNKIRTIDNGKRAWNLKRDGHSKFIASSNIMCAPNLKGYILKELRTSCIQDVLHIFNWNKLLSMFNSKWFWWWCCITGICFLDFIHRPYDEDEGRNIPWNVVV
jgi:hypothetical protein